MLNEQQPSESWYTVRCIFRTTKNEPWGPHDLKPGTSAYEERITLWRAASLDEAVAMAEVEAEDYAEVVGDGYLGFAQAYQLSDAPGVGVEIFSLIRNSDLDPDDYLERFFDNGTERQQTDAVDK